MHGSTSIDLAGDQRLPGEPRRRSHSAGEVHNARCASAFRVHACKWLLVKAPHRPRQ